MRLETSSRLFGSTKTYHGPQFTCNNLPATKRGTVSSNSRFQAVLFQQYSANPSPIRVLRPGFKSSSNSRQQYLSQQCPPPLLDLLSYAMNSVVIVMTIITIIVITAVSTSRTVYCYCYLLDLDAGRARRRRGTGWAPVASPRSVVRISP